MYAKDVNEAFKLLVRIKYGAMDLFLPLQTVKQKQKGVQQQMWLTNCLGPVVAKKRWLFEPYLFEPQTKSSINFFSTTKVFLKEEKNSDYDGLL